MVEDGYSPILHQEKGGALRMISKVYCGLGTYAMYAIWHHLQELITDDVTPVKSLASTNSQ